jgi:preprotein translocase subunit SecA
LPQEFSDEDQVYSYTRETVENILSDYAEIVYSVWETSLGAEARVAERLLLLRAIDFHWVQHLTTMENLRTGIGLHAIGQRDPLVMYRTEGHKTFQELLQRMQHDVVHTLFHVDVEQRSSNMGRRGRRNAVPESPMQGVSGRIGQSAAVLAGAKIGRNATCPCGSGRKYKRCCGANA